MALVTLIGEHIAEKGLVFTYLGSLNDCKECKLKNICFNLKPFHQYRIKKVRNKRHQCSVHEGEVIVVEVEKLALTAAIDNKYTKGSKITLKKKDCGKRDCKYISLCTSKALQENKKYKIIRVVDSIDCQQGHHLQKVELKE